MSRQSALYVLGAVLLTACSPTQTPTLRDNLPQASASPTASPSSSASPGPSASPFPSPTPVATPFPSPTPISTPTPTSTATPGVARVARLELNANLYRLTGRNDTAVIVVRAYDAAGNAIPLSQLELDFASSQPTRIRVDQNGLLTALTSTGTAVITVSDPVSGVRVQANSEIRSSGGGGGGGGGSSPDHDVTGDVDYSDVEFEDETMPV